MRASARDRRWGRRAATRRLIPALALAIAFTGALFGAAARAQEIPQRVDAGRFTFIAFRGDAALARHLLDAAQAEDTFPGLPRPVEHVTVAIAPDDARFREWTGRRFPEWGIAAAFPDARRIVMHGHRAGSEVGDPFQVLRHELAHLALAEFLGDEPPLWFDEGYASFAAGEWGRGEVLETNFALVWRGPGTFAALDSAFSGGATRASGAYALAYRAVAELAALDRERGLTNFFANWRAQRSLDVAVRRTYGMTLDAFEIRWRSRTRARYGVLALLADLSVVAGIIGLAVLPVYVRRRRAQRKRLETLRFREEEQARRARESTLDALLGERDEKP